MKRFLFSFTGIFLFACLFTFQVGVTSCQKELPIHDTVIIHVHDTLSRHDTLNYDPMAAHINDSLWAYYPFNNDVLDKSGNNRVLSLKNGLALSEDMWGKPNSCLKFDGINDFAVLDDGKNFPEGNFTIAIKFIAPALSGRIFQKVDYTNAKGASFALGFAPVVGKYLNYAISKDVNICNSFTDDNTIDLLKSPNLLSDSWYHAVIVHENGIQKLYINGILISSQKTTLPTFKNCTGASFNFGIWWLNDPQYFSGKLDDIRIYTRALKSNEIAYLSMCSML